MKHVICTICLLLVLLANGCTTCFYQPGKTLEQCTQDLLECDYEAEKLSFVPHSMWISPMSAGMQEGFRSAELCIKCMRVRGYWLVYKSKLPEGVRTQRVGDATALAAGG